MQRFTISFKYAVLLLLLFQGVNKSLAQCTSNTWGKYPAANFTNSDCSGTLDQVIAADCYQGEYSVVNVTSGQTYTFKSSVSTDLVTVSTGAATSTAVAYGTGSATWVSTLTGNVRFWLHTAACGSGSTERSRIVKCGVPPANDAGVTVVYTLGKLPLNFGSGHVVQAVIKNGGSSTLTDLVVSLNITGANTFSNVQTISSLASGASQTVSFAPFTPTAAGSNVITVTVPPDAVNTNNSFTWNQEVTQNLFSYKNPSASNEAGGVGFTGATGDFVAGFKTAVPGMINEVKVDFASGGQPYKVGIWDATGPGNAPGTLLWESASLTSAAGTAFISAPNVTVSDKYYVGVRQTGTTNVAFAFQTETPLRPANFYYTSPTGGTTWTDLSSTGSFRFSIEPQFFIPQAPNCPVSLAPADNLATVNPNATTTLSWASGGGGSTNYDVFFGTAYPPPFVGNTTNTTYPVTLLPTTTYYWSVVAKNEYGASAGCDTLTFTTVMPIANDNASGATPLAVGAACAGADYSTADATLSPGEPFPSCSGTGNNPVWFSFTAPSGGAVRVSTDAGAGGTLTDTKIALFSASDVNAYSTFNIIACDEDGGSGTFPNNSVLYATGLTTGATYYIAVDKYASTTTNGSFCITVDALSSSMLATSNSCASTFQTPYAPTGSANYTGWVPLLDASSKLVALVRNPAGGLASGFAPSQNVNTSGTVRQSSGHYYLDRNFAISNATVTNAEVQLFFLNTELAALTAVDPTATLNNLNVTHQPGTCNNDFNETAGTNTALLSTSAVNLGDMSYIRFTTPGFSNFYLMAGSTPLPIVIRSIDARNTGLSNKISWITETEHQGDYFELERSSDAKAFQSLTRIAGKGKASDYVYDDTKPFTGDNFYRLKLVSKDGSYVYSTIVKATVDARGFALEAYPNPASKNVTIKVSGSANGDLVVTDISGKVVLQTIMNGSESGIDFSKMAPGVYFIRYTDGNFSKTVKISRQ